MKDMIFEADRKTARQGDSVELRWDADMPDSLSVIIDNGIEPRAMQVGDSGSTRIYIGDSRGKYTFTLKARRHGKDETKTITVKVADASKSRKAKVAGVSSFQLWCEKRKAGWITFKNRLAYTWAVLPKKRKRLLKPQNLKRNRPPRRRPPVKRRRKRLLPNNVYEGQLFMSCLLL